METNYKRLVYAVCFLFLTVITLSFILFYLVIDMRNKLDSNMRGTAVDNGTDAYMETGNVTQLFGELKSQTNLEILDLMETIGWKRFNNSFLFYSTASTEMVNWETAQSHCHRRGARLLTKALGSDDNLDEMLSSGVLTKTQQSWISYNDIDQEGTWTWDVSGAFTAAVNWDTTEPNGGISENCGEILFLSGKFVFNDVNCSSELPYVCEKELAMRLES